MRRTASDVGGCSQTTPYLAQVLRITTSTFSLISTNDWNCFLRRSQFDLVMFFDGDKPFVYKSWGKVCHESLPNLEHTKLRQSLLLMEDLHGSTLSKRFARKENGIRKGVFYSDVVCLFLRSPLSD